MRIYHVAVMAALACVAFAGATPVSAQQARVCFFQHADFQGKRICARTGETRRSLPGFNNTISSITVRGGASVTVCQHEGLDGRCRTFGKDAGYVGDRWNDRISSFQVVRAAPRDRGAPDNSAPGRGEARLRNGVCFFEHSEFRGRRLCAVAGDVARRMPPDWNNRISSMRIRGAARVQVCSRNRLAGNCREFSRNRAYVGKGWNDRISSFRVMRGGAEGEAGPGGGRQSRNGVCLYENTDFDGRRLCARIGDSVRRMPAGWSNSVSSIRVGRNAEIQICERERFRGRCRVYDRNREYVGDRWNDRISSFRVAAKGGADAEEPVPPRSQFPAPGSANRDPNRICFFTKSKHRGRWFCDRPRNRVDRLPKQWRNDIESIRMFGGSTVKICDKPRLKGNCHIYERSQKRIGGTWSNKLSSYEILLPR